MMEPCKQHCSGAGAQPPRAGTTTRPVACQGGPCIQWCPEWAAGRHAAAAAQHTTRQSISSCQTQQGSSQLTATASAGVSTDPVLLCGAVSILDSFCLLPSLGVSGSPDGFLLTSGPSLGQSQPHLRRPRPLRSFYFGRRKSRPACCRCQRAAADMLDWRKHGASQCMTGQRDASACRPCAAP